MLSVKKLFSRNENEGRNIFRLIFFLLTVHSLSPSSDGSHYERRSTSDQTKRIAELDNVIEASAFGSSLPRKTGIINNVTLPTSLAGLSAQVVRLRSGSLRRRGFTFNEFKIPSGVIVDSSPRWIAMIYRDFRGLEIYAPEGYTLVAPVLGIKVYEFPFKFSVSETPPSELRLVSGSALISFRIPYLSLDQYTVPYCASFDAKGRANISNVSLAPNLCSSTHLGDFSLVVSSFVFSPASEPSALAPSSLTKFPPLGPNSTNLPKTAGSIVYPGPKASTAWKIYLAIAVGVILLVTALSSVLIAVINCAKNSKFSRMEHRAALGETLQTTLIGEKARAPAAGSIRTRPTLADVCAA